MQIIIKRASFNADDFNAEDKVRPFASARNMGDFVAIEIADHSFDAFKETLRETYAEYDRRFLEQHHADELERKQMMIRQIITKMFKP